jgi:hypothetical protein
VIVVENDNNKEEYVEQTLKAERYRLDEKRQAREMLDGARRDSIKVTEVPIFNTIRFLNTTSSPS